MDTEFLTSSGRKPQSALADLMQARLPLGTFARMDRVLRGGELRSAFLRRAVEAELQRREAGNQAVAAE
jgi:hypothetical protein